MPKKITYDNFGVQVGDFEMPGGQPARVIAFMERSEDGLMVALHEFPLPVSEAEKVGAALQGTAVVTAPADAMEALRQRVPPPNGGQRPRR